MSPDELDARARLNGAIPASLALPWRPVMSQGPADPRDPKSWEPARLEAGLVERGVAARDSFSEAFAARSELSRAYRARYHAGDHGAVRELLEREPEFLRERWVMDAARLLMAQGRFYKRARGRSHTRSREVLVIGLALVAFVDQQLQATGRSRDAIFHDLADAGFASLSYEGIKALYRRTKNDDRLEPLFFVG